jgi:hypothetical protein
VVWACNPRYVRGIGRRIAIWGWPWVKTQCSILKIKKKSAEGMA